MSRSRTRSGDDGVDADQPSRHPSVSRDHFPAPFLLHFYFYLFAQARLYNVCIHTLEDWASALMRTLYQPRLQFPLPLLLCFVFGVWCPGCKSKKKLLRGSLLEKGEQRAALPVEGPIIHIIPTMHHGTPKVPAISFEFQVPL